MVTSKPVHSLAAAVMEGVGSPTLLVAGSASPHTFQMKPSGARAVASASVFIRVSEQIEPFTEKLMEGLPDGVTVMTLAETPGLLLLDKRTSATFEAHADHEDHDDQGGHDHGGHDHEHGGAKDGHVWLDPANAKIMGDHIAQVLAAKDPAHAATYQANAAKLAANLDQLATEIAAQTAPLKGRPFIVFHDAIQYFENRFNVSAVGSVTVSPDVQPSAKRISELRRKVAGLSAACVFAEPLYKPNLVAAVTEDTTARSGTIDPEGIALEPGPGLYFTLMRSVSASLSTCLKPTS